MKHIKLVAASVTALAATVATATEYIYQGTVSDRGIFHDFNGSLTDVSSWWADGLVPGLSVVSDATLGGAADIRLGAGSGLYQKNVRMASESADQKVVKNVKDWYFNSISGDEKWRLEFPYVAYSYAYGRDFHIADPSQFYGLWWQQARNHRGPYRPRIIFESWDPEKAIVRRALAEGRMGFGVWGSDTAQLVEPIGMGAFTVNDEEDSNMSGSLEVIVSPGGRSNPTVFRGKLLVHGNADPGAAVVGDPWLHLDASVASSLTVSDGKVTEWRDVRGNGLKGTRHEWVSADPTLGADAKSGLAVVDFGAFAGKGGDNNKVPPSAADVATFGDYSGLQLNRLNHNVKEMFVVFKDHEIAAAAPSLVGVTDSYMGNPNGAVNRFIRDWTRGALFRNEWTQGAYADERAPQNQPLNWSEIRVDGQRVLPHYADNYAHGFHVVSVGLPEGVTSSVNSLACSRDVYWQYHIGGTQIGEVLCYTNALTVAERRKVNNYLRRKWLKDETDYDFGSIELRNDATVEVVDGTAQVREIILPAGTTSFTKTGAGTLVVDRFVVGNEVKNLPVVVQEGAFRFGTGFGTVSETMAPDPDVWFDASQIDAADLEGDYVKVWRDPRGTNPKGVAVTAERHPIKGVYGPYATLLPGAANGRNVVSFGARQSPANLDVVRDWESNGLTCAPYDICRDGAADPATMPNYDTDASCRVREGFMVLRIKGNGTAPIWATSVGDNMDFHGSTLALYEIGFANANVDAAYWQVNGLPFNAYQHLYLPNKEFVVVSFATSAKVPVDAFAMDRGGSGNDYGGLDVAECLHYDRLLTPVERRNTTAYLMKKWLGKDHPDKAVEATAHVARVETGVELSTAGDGTLPKVEEPSGTLIKTGAGSAVVDDAMNFFAFDGFDVREGSLDIGLGASNVMAKAYFHVDAEESKMTITGETYVTVWNDVRDNGRAAYAYNDAKIVGGASPQIGTYEINGRERKALSFGPKCGSASKWGSAMTWFSPSKGQDSQKKKYAELYTIHRDYDANHHGYLFGTPNYVVSEGTDLDGNASKSPYPFYRTGLEITSGTTHSYPTYMGEVYVDDVKTTGAYRFNDCTNFHMFAFYPVYPVHAGGFANRETYEWGGVMTAESMVFEQPNSETERTILRAFLQRKWFGTGTAYAPSFASINVEKDAALNVSTDDGVADWRVAALSGGGTISVGRDLTDVGAIAVRFGSPDEYDCLTVDGALALADGCTVTVDVGFDKVPAYGAYRIVAADAVTGELPELVLSHAVTSGTVSLEKRADGLYLVLTRPALTILLK